MKKTTREVWKRNDAISHFKKIGEYYKSEIVKDIPKEEGSIDLLPWQMARSL